jgi:hypothetical protein
MLGLRRIAVLDDIHDYLLTNLAIRLDQAASSKTDGSSDEVLFMHALQLIGARKDELTPDDLATIGDWLHETGDYFALDDFLVVEIVLVRNPSKSGRRVQDLRPLVQAARAARTEKLKR